MDDFALKLEASSHLQAGRITEATATVARWCECEPANADAWFNYGRLLHQSGQVARAIDAFEQALILQPGAPPVIESLAAAHRTAGSLLIERGMTHEAHQHLVKSLHLAPDDPHGASLVMAGLGVAPLPQRAPDAFLKQLYRSRSLLYDKPNRYRGAILVADALKGLSPFASKPCALDLGCGTGAVGALIREFAGQLDGVDISAEMLAIAKGKSIYDNLYCVELLTFLAQAAREYDAITAAAVVIHFGPLDALFGAVAKCLTHNGLFVFTAFPAQDRDRDYSLAPLGGLGEAGIYLHSQEYIRKSATSFVVESLRAETHEYSKNEPRSGLVVALRRV
jgi:predicted TPR repeat methyltransferase